MTEVQEVTRSSAWNRAARIIGYIVLGFAALLLVLVAFLHTPPGRQMIIDQVAKYAPASGLSVEVGSIEGSVLWSATFNDLRLRDANDVLFLEVPQVDLNWRPHRWFTSGLDVRHLVLTGGTLHAMPELLAGDPDAPLLPDFDIRIDNLVVQDLRVAEGVLGEERLIQFRAKTDIRGGRVMVDADGEFGGADEFALLVDAQPDNDLFDLDLDWQAPAGGFLASMVGAEEDLSVELNGEGSWTEWRGELLAVQGGAELANLDIFNEAGQYRLDGIVRPASYVEGITAAALGQEVAITGIGTLTNSVLAGRFGLRGSGVDISGSGAADLANNLFDNFAVEAQLLDPNLFGEGIALENARLQAALDGPFRELSAPTRLTIGRLTAGDMELTGLAQSGTISFDGSRVTIPLNAQIVRVVSGVAMADPRLINGRVGGTLTYVDGQLMSDDLSFRFPGLTARLGLEGDLGTGVFQLKGPVNAADLVFENIGTLDAGAQIDFTIGGGAPWSLSAQLQGRMDQVSNATIANVAGQDIRFLGGIALGETRPLSVQNMRLLSSKLELNLDGRFVGDQTIISGTGSHVDYGPLTFDATLDGDGPRADLVFENPLPAAALKDVRVSIAPSENGFAIETSGGSVLGPFAGLVDLTIGDDGEVGIGISRLDVAESRVAGTLALVEGGVNGRLDLSRGGLDGAVLLSVRDGAQAFEVDASARNARFGGATPLSLARADMNFTGFLGGDMPTVHGVLTAQGVSYGSLFLGRFAVEAELEDGVGSFDAALAGRRGSRFELLLNGRATTEQIAIAADGSYAGQDITMPRRAVLSKTADGGWQLPSTQIAYGGGFAILSGRVGGEEPTAGRLSLDQLPIALADALAGDLGLGGTVSGVVEFQQDVSGLPTGEARILLNGLTRSGLLLTSRPMDIAATLNLSPSLLQARAVMQDEGGAHGRLAGRISNLAQAGGLPERLSDGSLFAQMRYDGPASALWRLAALDLMDITGELQLAANVRGTLANPQVRGSLEGDDLRVQSALTGTDVTNVRARGRFEGSRLQLTSFAGSAPNGGRVSGSGFVDLAGMSSTRGPEIDLRLAARNARILQLSGMGAAVTGPMRIVSNGMGGTIAGRLVVDAAEWRLGTAEVISPLPDLEITEVNTPADIAPPRRQGQPWRYLIDASTPDGIKVEGMGLDSEWGADIALRGTTADPRIGGEARIVPRQGFYSFAGVRFDITRGRIEFDETAAPDPSIDLIAETDVSGLEVSVSVQGRASQPEITFSSVPALPEEELLARLLFGGSITELGATDALQLGAALASLQGGGGMDPINSLRNAIGLDRLRIVPSDPALGRGTAVALGENIGRRFYVEIITDGQNYNATELEFRITSWLSLLGAINTVGRASAEAQYSRDY